jgi:tetratricopeptide (TPR) repeat protein
MGTLLGLLLPCGAAAQGSHGAPAIPTITPGQNYNAGSIYITVKTASGSYLNTRPDITLISTSGAPTMSVAQPAGHNEWVIPNVRGGMTYIVEVSASGYKTEQQFVMLSNTPNTMERVRIYMHPLGGKSSVGNASARQFLLTPTEQRDVQRAVKDLGSNKIADAQKRLKKVYKLAPSHPGVNYLLGLSYLRGHELTQAKQYLEKSISINPTQVPAMLALGIVRFDQKDYAGAIEMMTKVVAKRPSSWPAQWILASSYLNTKNFQQALVHAQEAMKAGQKRASGARLVLGEALAGLGKRKQAAKELETFVKENRHDPSADRARVLIKKLRQPTAAQKAQLAATNPLPASAKSMVSNAPNASATSSRAAASGPATSVAPAPAPALPLRKNAELLPKPGWAPPDVDTVQPPVKAGVACHLPLILRSAGRKAEAWVKELQEFSATEHYQSVEINHHGNVGEPFVKDFQYMVFVHKIRPHVFQLQILRQPKPDLQHMGSPLFGMGTVGLALVFHPDFRNHFSWSCDGLGKWKGRPAWVIHFAQLPNRPIARMIRFKTIWGSERMPLKGVAWLSQRDDHVMHLETDLVKPVDKSHLERDHFSISYRKVKFHSHPVELWLPERVDMYAIYRGHAYHNYSRYSHFELFWTGTEQKLGKPKENKPRE